jgi:biotin transport system substrate-specific component
MKKKYSNTTKYITLTKIIISIIIVSISAQMTIDVGDIPITGQTLSILVIALLLDPREVFITMVGYILLGCLGLPIFADGASGISKLMGGSGGFLIGFLISAVSISYIFQASRSKGWHVILLLTVLGTIIILIFGVGRLAMLYGLEKGIEYGFTPFWKGAVIKIFLGSGMTWLIRKYLL